MKVRILGSGTSTGVPQIGCTCPVCTSADPKDNRLRASAIVETEDARILIACGPDFRAQVLHLPFEKIDGVLITHEHYDHVGGLDDLRPFCRFGAVPIYAEEYVARALRSRMPYCFVDHRYPGVPGNRDRTRLFHPPYGSGALAGDARSAADSGLPYRQAGVYHGYAHHARRIV